MEAVSVLGLGWSDELRTIWSLMRLPSSSIVRILKSIPMVVMKEGVHASSQKRRRRHDLPTPRGWLRNKMTMYLMPHTRIADEQEL